METCLLKSFSCFRKASRSDCLASSAASRSDLRADSLLSKDELRFATFCCSLPCSISDFRSRRIPKKMKASDKIAKPKYDLIFHLAGNASPTMEDTNISIPPRISYKYRVEVKLRTRAQRHNRFAFQGNLGTIAGCPILAVFARVGILFLSEIPIGVESRPPPFERRKGCGTRRPSIQIRATMTAANQKNLNKR